MATTEKQPKQPLFDTDAVSIDVLTTAPEGIKVATRKTMGRRALREAHGHPTLTPEQVSSYGDALRREAQFQGVKTFREQVAGENVSFDEAQEAWRTYRENAVKSQKVGLRAPEFDPDTNTLSVDVVNVSFPTYNLLSQPGNSPEMQAFTEATGNAMVVKTADNRLVVQHRAIQKPRMLTDGQTRGNALYADIPGASVAGMFDATPSETPGVPQPIDNESITAGIMKEAGEELGLGNEHLKDVRIVGLAKDKIKPHDEFLFLAATDLTEAELNEASRTSKRNKNLGDADFEEKFDTIEASPSAIYTLLADVKCPLPPTHSAAMVAAGYAMVLEQGGLEAANAWRADLETAMNDNIRKINETVANYYNRFFEADEISDVEKKIPVPERFWGKEDSAPKRNLEGYSPAYGPEEQGLPSLEDELVRTGLKPETREKASRIKEYDVDGVLTDPHEKRVIHDALFDKIVDQLRNEEYVALNSGRSSDWVAENVASQLIDRVGEDKGLLERLSIIGEKGGSWITYNKQGEAHHGYAPSLTLPDGVSAQIIDLLTSNKEFSETMTVEVDPYKKTMVSPEMSATPEGVSPEAHLARFHQAQARFAEEVQQLLENNKLDKRFGVDKTTIATDIESPHAGKDLGVERHLEILRAQGVNVQSAEFKAFGDSPSDIAMAEELQRRGLKVEFVNVGNGQVTLKKGYDFPVHQQGNFTSGTLEYLQTS